MPSEKNKPQKGRYHLIMTYASEKQIQDVVLAHQSSIRAWSYIYHDKDEAKPHYHVIIRTYSTWYNTAIEKWFKGLKDKSGEYINTFCEKANDLVALEQYLTHDDFESQQKGKHRYPKSAIRDYGLWDIVPCKDSFDDSYDVINDIISGMTVRDLVRRYGRDYVYHRFAYEEIADKIITEDGFSNSQRQVMERRTRLFEQNLDEWDKGL